MAREFGPVNVEIWSDPEWRKLPPAAQHLYLTLWTSPALSYCGVHDWRPGRLAALSRGFSGEHIQTVADCLTARHFFVVDHDTEEVLVRSWARFDGLLKQPRMAVSYASAYASVASETLRAVLVHETQKIRDEHPGLTCWNDQRVARLFEHPSVSAKDLPTPKDPFGEGFGDGFGLGLPQTAPAVWASVSLPPTPTPTPAPTPHSLGGDSSPAAKTKKATQLPADFQPSDAHRALAAELQVDLAVEFPQFVDHHRAKGSTMKDWDAALRTWVRNAPKFRGARSAAPERPRHLTAARDLEQPPDGLSPQEYAEWHRERRERLRAT